MDKIGNDKWFIFSLCGTNHMPNGAHTFRPKWNGRCDANRQFHLNNIKLRINIMDPACRQAHMNSLYVSGFCVNSNKLLALWILAHRSNWMTTIDIQVTKIQNDARKKRKGEMGRVSVLKKIRKTNHGFSFQPIKNGMWQREPEFKCCLFRLKFGKQEEAAAAKAETERPTVERYFFAPYLSSGLLYHCQKGKNEILLGSILFIVTEDFFSIFLLHF